MNSCLNREYFVLKTMNGDAIGLVSLIRPMTDASSYTFALQRPEYKDTLNEFMDLTFTKMDYPEYETHRDVFKTHGEIEVVNTFYSSSDMTNTLYVIVRKQETDE